MALIALNRQNELGFYIPAALRNGLSREGNRRGAPPERDLLRASRCGWSVRDLPGSHGRRGGRLMRTEPPFRADHVGSLLRPPELLRPARSSRKAGCPPTSCGESKTTRFAMRCGCRRRSASSPPPTVSSAVRRGTWTSSTSSTASTRLTSRSGRVPQRAGRPGVHRGGPPQRPWASRPLDDDLRRCVRSAEVPPARRRRRSSIPSPSMVHYRGGRQRSARTSTRMSRSSGTT